MLANWHKPKRVNLADAHDIKLELDVRCQKLIEKTLRAAFPKIPLLGEEGDSGNVNAEYRWVVDPIDGTVNYAHGMPHAAVSIALQDRTVPQCTVPSRKSTSHPPSSMLTSSHETLLGVIYDPFTDELWTATRGGPTRLNGRIVRVSNRANAGRRHHRHGIFQEQNEPGEKPAALEPPFPPGIKSPDHGFGGA